MLASVAKQGAVECPQLRVKLLGQRDVGGVVGALALELPGHGDHGGAIGQAVKADLNCDDALPCDFCIGGVDLVRRDVAGQGVGDLEAKERRRVKGLFRLFPGTESFFK